MKTFQRYTALPIADKLLDSVSVSKSAVYHGTAGYSYTGAKHDACPFPALLAKVATMLENKDNLPVGYFNMCLTQYYPSGKGLGRHRDNEPEIGSLSTIASVSLGASRIFSITHGYTNPYAEVLLKHGDVFFMRGRSQLDYYHAVFPGKGERYNLTFRHNPAAPVRP